MCLHYKHGVWGNHTLCALTKMIIENIEKHLLNVPEVAAWPEIREIFRKWEGGPRPDWTWPVLACQAVGGEQESAIPGAAAIACMQISIILVDDILDEDPRGEHLRVGYGPASNLALAFQAAAFRVLDQAKVSPEVKAKATNSLSWLALKTALGQHLDNQNLSGEENYWKVVEAKSTPFYGATFQIGALLGGASLDVAARLCTLGIVLGEIIQIRDDILDAFETPANPDWTQGRNNLAILYARTANHPERERFLELFPQVQDENALREAQRILIKSGAVSYCTYQLIERQRKTWQMIQDISLVNPAPLKNLLARETKPLENLLKIGDREISLDTILDYPNEGVF